MTFKIRYVAPAVMGLAAAISFVNVTLFLIFDPSTATLWDKIVVGCAMVGVVLFGVAMWICVSAIIKGRRI